MSYDIWFTEKDYGCRSGEHEAHIRVHAINPTKLTNDRIAWYDQSAARTIAEAEALVDDLKAYRCALAARYAYLETSPYTRTLKIERSPGWTSGVSYYITITRKYEDGTESAELSEHYSGKERHTALKRFDELKKAFPGITTVKDIEKRSWERR